MTDIPWDDITQEHQKTASNTLPALKDIKDIKFDFIKSLIVDKYVPTKMFYDPIARIMTMYFADIEGESIVHYISDNMALIYDNDTSECVGFQLENI